MSISHPAAWLRIAGNSMSIKSRLPARWRCYVNRTPPVIPLVEWRVSGTVTGRNFVTGTAPDGDENGLIAWIDVYGVLTVDEKLHAVIELREP